MLCTVLLLFCLFCFVGYAFGCLFGVFRFCVGYVFVLRCAFVSDFVMERFCLCCCVGRVIEFSVWFCLLLFVYRLFLLLLHCLLNGFLGGDVF